MKRNQKRRKRVHSDANKRTKAPTLFKRMMDLQIGLCDSLELPLAPDVSKNQSPMPAWSKQIFSRLKRTIFKPVLKLKFNGKVNLRNYGRTIGIIQRYLTFVRKDVPGMLDKLTDEQWERICPLLGLDELRVKLIKFLQRPVSDDEPLEKLAEEAWERQSANLEKHRQIALQLVAQMDAKGAALFFKGMAEGFTIYYDELGNFPGDRGRTEIYWELLGAQFEIEKMRRTLPSKSRRDLYEHLKPTVNFHPKKGMKWLNDICDEIGLSMKPPGRPFEFPARPKSPAF